MGELIEKLRTFEDWDDVRALALVLLVYLTYELLMRVAERKKLEWEKADRQKSTRKTDHQNN